MSGPVRVDPNIGDNAKVWRVVWEDGGFTFMTDWSIHYDPVWNLYHEYREAMPGAEVTMQSAEVETVKNIRDLNFNDGN